MHDLDTLIEARERVKLAGVEYEIPASFSSLPMRAIPIGSRLRPVFARLEKDPSAMTDGDVDLLMQFIHAATSIPQDVLKDAPYSVIVGLIEIMNGKPDEDKDAQS